MQATILPRCLTALASCVTHAGLFLAAACSEESRQRVVPDFAERPESIAPMGEDGAGASSGTEDTASDSGSDLTTEGPPDPIDLDDGDGEIAGGGEPTNGAKEPLPTDPPNVDPGAAMEGIGGCPTAAGTNPNRVCIKGRSYYLNGINVAWNQYAGDLTNFDAARFEAMFSSLEAAGGNSVRWWWFIDGQNQLLFSGNLVQPLSQQIFTNLDQAFDLAAAHGILLMPVFLSFDIQSRGREFLVTNEAATDAFVANVVRPLVERYDKHPALGLWEIMNEGDWLLTSEGGTVSVADYQRFHGKVAAGIHTASSGALVTTGSATFKYLGNNDNILSDEALRSAAGGDALAHLDVYQTHYYSWMHGDGWSFEPWIQTSTEWLGAGKPILVGEFGCRGEPGRWTARQMHVESINQGYAGSFCWAYFDNRSDDEGTWADAEPHVRAIATQIPNAIAGE